MPLLFAVTLFVSAVLLFLVQPMIAKMILPKFGGTPAVWNTCMVFFQAALLAGYAYSHATTDRLGSRRQSLLHMVLIFLPFLVLPIALSPSWAPPGDANPAPQVLLLLLVTVGLPFFVVSTSAPLLQNWFAGTGHPSGKDPYFLYAASNLGSMLALLSYPLVVEPNLKLAAQSKLWLAGYGVLGICTIVCAVVLWRSRPIGRVGAEERGSAAVTKAAGSLSLSHSPTLPLSHSPSLGRRLRWVALAFVPSSLMLGVTTYLSTDIAAVPLLWVIPLSLYLLSFILVFSRLPSWIHLIFVILMPIVILAVVFQRNSDFNMAEWIIAFTGVGKIVWVFLLQLIGFFFVAMYCHGELAQDRPSTSHLTEFYLWMSLGGVLGGVFNALIAPLVFKTAAEYPLLLMAACLVLPATAPEARNPVTRWLEIIMSMLVCGMAAGFLFMRLLSQVNTGSPGPPFLNLRALESLLSLNRVQFFGVLAIGLLLGLVYIVRRKEGAANRALDLLVPVALGVLAAELILRVPDIVSRQGTRVLVTLGDREYDWGWLNWLAGRLALSDIIKIVTYGTPLVMCYAFVERPIRFGLGIGAILLVSAVYDEGQSNTLLRARSYFGILHVDVDVEDRYESRIHYYRLMHGTTTHGTQLVFSLPHSWDYLAAYLGAIGSDAPLHVAVADSLWREERDQPRTYYHRDGPVGHIMKVVQAGGKKPHLAFIGLGTGTVASYVKRDQRATFYEIDATVVHIAQQSGYFTYWPDAVARGAKLDLVLGDARVQLEKAPDEKYGLIVVDAFSSDAIPIHLITREAIALYLQKLAPDGLLAIHISNKYLDLEPVVANLAEHAANLAEHAGLQALVVSDSGDDRTGKYASHWVVLARTKDHLKDLAKDIERWPGDPDNFWRDMLHKPSVGKLSVLEMDQWRTHRVYRTQRNEHLTDEQASALQAGMALLSTDELKQMAQKEIDETWDKNLAYRRRVGLWEDDFSNLISVFLEWRHK